MILTALVVFVGGTAWTIVYSFTNSKLLPRCQFVGLDQYERLWSHQPLADLDREPVHLRRLLADLLAGHRLPSGRAAGPEDPVRKHLPHHPSLPLRAQSFIVTGLVWQWILNPDFGIQHIVRGLGWESFTFDPLYNPDIVIYGILIAGLWQGTGLIMCLMLAGLRGIDEDIWKAARVDGIPTWKTYLFIVIPMMRPVFITTLVIIASRHRAGLRSGRRADPRRARDRLRGAREIRL